MENIVFGLMVMIAVGAGIFTCIYEVGGSSCANAGEQPNAEHNKKQSE